LGAKVEVPSSSLTDAGEGFYKAYEEHSKTLRTWLVAYGIGAPVLFLTNDSLAGKLASSPQAGLIGVVFLIGTLLQVLLAALNKGVMWACYYAAAVPDANADGP
jgi:hypothetical protein